MTSLELGRINRVTKLKGIVIFKQNKDAAADPSFPGRSVALRLISATIPDGNGKGKVGKRTYMGSLVTSETTMEETLFYFNIMFEWDIEMMGVPGAFFIENFMQCELFLTSLTLNDVPNNETINFVCNSWIYNAKKYQTERIFFTNQTYLPIKIPAPLKHYIEEELKTLRGDGTGKREEWERIYDYDVYNDLSEPDRDVPLRRPVLGGSSTFGGSCTLPYPRRVRTGREPTKKDKKSESRRGRIYIPRDELLRQDESLKFNQEFNTFEDVLSLFDIKIKHRTDILSKLNKTSLSNELSPTNGESVPKIPKFPTPKVIAEDHYAWMTDEEFAREMIAGVNPNVIEKLLELPRKSKLDSQLYGDNTSTITEEHLKPNMNGVTVENAIRDNRLYILDHHDPLYPYLRKINETEAKAYATRTILFLQDDGTLKPLAIELSRPHPQGDSVGPLSNVYLPSTKEPEALIWLLAKAYVVVNDSCYHQLVSHWLKTHCVVEPFIIATNRHLSVVHPIHKLLVPHYRGTMTINARSRNILINAQGIVESTFLLDKYAMEMSAVVYKDWVFTEQGLHNDLIKRGVAVKDGSSPHGLRLLIKDYPYASDGLEIWAAIKSWVEEYVNFYYESDEDIDDDDELKAFWKELVEVGHGDLKNNATLWVKMKTRGELIETCTTLIWIASALHAAVNFGQYQYGGYILNRPTKSIKFMPEKGSPEYDELAKDYMKTYLMTISPKDETLEVMKTMLVLSMHDPNEQYLGQRTEGDLWTSDSEPVKAYKRFAKKLIEIEEELIQRNNDELLKNRYGPVKMPYTLLYPSSGAGLTGRGIPNSVSI